MTQYHGLELDAVTELVNAVHEMMVTIMSEQDYQIDAYEPLRPAVYPKLWFENCQETPDQFSRLHYFMS